MQAKDVLEKVKSYIDEYLADKPYELCDLQFVKEGGNWFLRVFADKEGGITIDDLEGISRTLEARLDLEDIIEQAYILEVSSPGIDRPLKTKGDYEKYAGRMVDVKLYQAQNGTKEFQGKLLGFFDEKIVIEGEEFEKLEFELTDVAICRLAVIF
ncbi:MAG: ribosome maturation factor RimP [Defluviitaleaceae bacterium]|nr:ribosome maturation factor RimP [Defluviitaleaceae bacterium]